MIVLRKCSEKLFGVRTVCPDPMQEYKSLRVAVMIWATHGRKNTLRDRDILFLTSHIIRLVN